MMGQGQSRALSSPLQYVKIRRHSYDNNGLQQPTVRAKEFLMSLHGAVTLIAEYAFACASSNTKLKLSQEEMTNLFEKRGYDHNERSTISLRDL
jgi:hypothetical protein